MPKVFSAALGHLADAGNSSHGERRKKRGFAAGRNPDQTARLGLIAGDFCDQARGAEAAGTGQRRRRRDFAQKLIRGGERRAVQPLGAGEIQIGFVDRRHFHDGRIFREDRGDAVAPLAVELVMAVEEDRLRAKLRGGAQRHGGMDAESSRLVAR